jgi:hypothetical protein
MRLHHSLRALIPVGVAVGALCGAPAALAAYPMHATPVQRVTYSTSTNWSGYAVTGAGPYTSVASSWIEPAVTCGGTTAYSAFWVGLDGDGTSTVEQTGTDSDCRRGSATYYAWYEMYPAYPVNFANPVSPGDVMTASVTASSAKTFTLTISDVSQGWTQTVAKSLSAAKLGSAEVIAEAPSSGKVLPLADFGTVGFGSYPSAAPIASSVNGQALTNGTSGLDPITMESKRGALEAVPSAISNGAFTDTWYSA